MFSVVIVRGVDDSDLRDLRREVAFDAAMRAQSPDWTSGPTPSAPSPSPTSWPGGPLLNVYRGQATEDGDLVLPGLVFVGDSVATTTPVFGRGHHHHAVAVRGTAEPARPRRRRPRRRRDGVRRHGRATSMRPWVEDHILMDADRVARWSGRDVDLDGPCRRT